MKISFEDIKHYDICSGNPAHRPSLVDFANVITKKLSLLICGHVSHQEGTVNIANLKEGMQAWLKDHQIAGYYSFVQHTTLSGGTHSKTAIIFMKNVVDQEPKCV